MHLRWYESWIVRAALVAFAVLLCGYAASVMMAIQSIDSIANFAHDESTEKALGEHLERIKEIQSLNEQIVLIKVREAIQRKYGLLTGPVAEKLRKTPPQKGDIVALLTAAEITEWVDLKQIKLSELAPRPTAEDLQKPCKWLDHEHLQIFNYVAEVPRGALFADFKAAESVWQRYQLMGVSLKDKIRPSLIKSNAIIFCISFILLAGTFTLLARRFKRSVEELIKGFSRWSATDMSYRFRPTWAGELRLIAMQFNTMADEVEKNRERSLYLEKIASWQIIARKLAHEIKNPLTPIQMMVSQLRRHYQGQDKTFGKLLDDAESIISQEVTALRRLVDNFSHFAKLPVPKRTPTDLIVLCQHASELMRNAFTQHEFRVVTPLPAAIAEVDGELLRQVVINLLKNAGEACGSMPSVIQILIEDDVTFFVIAVEDNGPGIPEEVRGRVFEAYFTTKDTGPTPGMGLGLAICQKIVLDHGGDISIKSRPGRTTFSVRTPKKEKDLLNAGK